MRSLIRGAAASFWAFAALKAFAAPIQDAETIFTQLNSQDIQAIQTELGGDFSSRRMVACDLGRQIESDHQLGTSDRNCGNESLENCRNTIEGSKPSDDGFVDSPFG